jgi:hypothetical protein
MKKEALVDFTCATVDCFDQICRFGAYREMEITPSGDSPEIAEKSKEQAQTLSASVASCVRLGTVATLLCKPSMSAAITPLVELLRITAGQTFSPDFKGLEDEAGDKLQVLMETASTAAREELGIID